MELKTVACLNSDNKPVSQKIWFACKQAQEAGGCATGYGEDMGDRGNWGHRWHRGKAGTGLTGSTVLRHEIEPKMGEISNIF